LKNSVMPAVLEKSPTQYQIDPNGIPIKPGYRKPFTSETARQSRAKAEVNLQAERDLYRKLGLHKQRRPRNLLYAVQQAIVRHCNFSCEPNLADCGMAHAKNAKLFTDIYLTITGRNPTMVNQPKRGHKPHLAGPSPSPLQPSSTPLNSPTITPQSSDQNASRVKPEGVNSAESGVCAPLHVPGEKPSMSGNVEK
jgi:hypothetical protein